jgi:hypothetical protein
VQTTSRSIDRDPRGVVAQEYFPNLRRRPCFLAAFPLVNLWTGVLG